MDTIQSLLLASARRCRRDKVYRSALLAGARELHVPIRLLRRLAAWSGLAEGPDGPVLTEFAVSLRPGERLRLRRLLERNWGRADDGNELNQGCGHER